MILCETKLPKISCLLVTARDRLDYFKLSYRCYLEQTYPNRELVVVNEGPREYQDALAAVVADRPDVKTVFLDGWYSLGALRNISFGLCSGDIWVQWDDDDFSVPERLAIQYRFFSKHPEAKVCCLSDQLHYYFPTRELFWESWSGFHGGQAKKWSLIPGTIMARRGLPFKYPAAGNNCSAGEDSVLLTSLCDQKSSDVALLSGAGYAHVYSYHGRNVWEFEHHRAITQIRSYDVPFMLKHRDRISETVEVLGLGKTNVMGREGLAFTIGD